MEPSHEKLREGRLSAEEADRLASEIRPAWELDDGTFSETSMDEEEMAVLAGDVPSSASQAPTDRTPPPTGAQATRIDGTPMVAIGGEGESKNAGFPPSTERSVLAPGPKPARTMLGLGVDAAEKADAEEPANDKPQGLSAAARTEPKGPGDTLESAKPAFEPKPEVSAAKPAVSAAKPAVKTIPGGLTAKPASGRPTSARPSEDAVEIPMAKGGKGLPIAIGVVVVAALGIGAFVAFSGDSKPPAPSPTTTAAAAPTPAPEPTPTPSQTATAAATATAPATAAAPSAPPASPTATTKPPEKTASTPTATAAPKGTTAAPKGTTSPAPKGTSTGKGTGIMRTTPF